MLERQPCTSQTQRTNTKEINPVMYLCCVYVCVWVSCNLKHGDGERLGMSAKLWEAEGGATEVPREEKTRAKALGLAGACHV